MKVVKKNQEIEKFELSKLVDSLIGTFEMAKVPEGASNDLIRKTVKNFHAWAKGKSEITSYDIRLKISEILDDLNPEAAHIYKNFKNII